MATQKQQQRRPDPRSKKCPFCQPGPSGSGRAGGKGALSIDYKDYPVLKPYTDYFGNIRNRYYTGVCLRHQKMLRLAIERARFMGMIAYRK
ncbi:MAG: 30S ribosomal protein S18 [Candidatus Peregrinibacteria bacterium Greene0416_19]|nr:MAG: 30S ribosomal protein S18 [Candidatus Peregrinibacteria bacterium Greene0416_19]